MKRILILCVLILFYHSLSAQNKIVGKITDQDNLPLPGATIFISDLNKGTISDKNGNYEVNKFTKWKEQNSVFIYWLC